jgi:AAA15 family ATPase/GTPase
MLLQFNFSNYRSFKSQASLDLTATGISELSGHIVEMGRDRVLPVAVLFGANASGKSNVFKAFAYMKDLVVTSFAYGGEIAEGEGYPPPLRFAWSKENKEPALFEVHFVDHATLKTINYGFTLDDDGIAEEWLNEKAKSMRTARRVFYRSRNAEENEFSGFSAVQTRNVLSALDPKVLIVSLANKLQIPKCSNVVGWFARCLTVDYGDPTENLERCTSVSSQFVTAETQNHVLSFLSIFDKSIKGFNVDEIPGEGEGKRKVFHIDALHQGLESDDLIPIPLQEESAGTIKLFSLYWSLLPALKNGTPLFIDEMNARLHPLLVRNLVLLFTDQTLNPHHAQLIFTSHDTWHLSNKSLRRDEIWFTAKSDLGASVLYSLADFKDEAGDKIRKDEDYEKNYLLGKYGAIPSIEQIKTIFPDYQGG